MLEACRPKKPEAHNIYSGYHNSTHNTHYRAQTIGNASNGTQQNTTKTMQNLTQNTRILPKMTQNLAQNTRILPKMMQTRAQNTRFLPKMTQDLAQNTRIRAENNSSRAQIPQQTSKKQREADLNQHTQQHRHHQHRHHRTRQHAGAEGGKEPNGGGITNNLWNNDVSEHVGENRTAEQAVCHREWEQDPPSGKSKYCRACLGPFGGG